MAPIKQTIHQLFLHFWLWKISVIMSILPLGRCLLNTSVYGLNAPFAGCQDNWFEVDVHVFFESLSTHTAISDPFSANINIQSPDWITIRFCVWNGTENTVPPTPAAPLDYQEENSYDIDGLMYETFFNFGQRSAGYVDSWPPGKYCIYNVGKLQWNETSSSWGYGHGSCPEGFEPGTSSYPFIARPNGSGATIYSPLGPFITHYNRTSIEFCCSRPAPKQKARAISLPFVRPFYLLPVEDKECQKVKGAEVRLEWIQWPHLYIEGGSHPYIEESEFKNGTKLYMCYYIPNANRLVASLTYIITLGSVVLSISLFLLLGWCNRKRIAWDHSRMLSLQYSGCNKNDYV